jgi:hypothetical protein
LKSCSVALHHHISSSSHASQEIVLHLSRTINCLAKNIGFQAKKQLSLLTVLYLLFNTSAI